ncbi:MAG: methyltransferase domain-containing protein [Planctomycetota bacterium]|nr:methyltransferase domain-containing protein [Planctomycetota bacterium]
MRESSYEREPGYALRYRDRRWVTGSGAGTDARERRVLRALLERAARGGGAWLDAPSGAGRLSGELPGRVVQVDRDPAMVLAAGDAAARACASVHALPFMDGAFGGVLCMRLLQHIETSAERVQILGELRRVSRGPVVVSFFDAMSLQHLRRKLRSIRGKRASGRVAIQRADFAREADAAGLQVLTMSALRRFFGEQTLALCLPRGDGGRA